MGNEHGYHGNTENHLARLRRIEGQVRGLQRMISQGDYCIDILTQVSAAQSALDSVAVNLLKDHMNHCVVTAARESDEAAQAKIDEAAAQVGGVGASALADLGGGGRGLGCLARGGGDGVVRCHGFGGHGYPPGVCIR